MLRHLMTGFMAATVVIVAAGCSSTTSTTPRFGYAGPPPLFSYQDGYVEDQTATGPIPTWANQTNVPGSRRYSRFGGVTEEWYTFSMVLQAPWRVRGPAGAVANGWQLAPIFQVQTGLDYLAGTSGTAPGAASSGGGINVSDGSFRLGAIARNTFHMPGTQNLDLRLSKNVPIKDEVTLELRADAFNLFNHFNATTVNSTACSVTTSGTITDTAGNSQSCSSAAPCLNYNTAFGSITAANSNFIFSTRQIQLGVKLHFERFTPSDSDAAAPPPRPFLCPL